MKVLNTKSEPGLHLWGYGTCSRYETSVLTTKLVLFLFGTN
jgi:hypothetical protein